MEELIRTTEIPAGQEENMPAEEEIQTAAAEEAQVMPGEQDAAGEDAGEEDGAQEALLEEEEEEELSMPAGLDDDILGDEAETEEEAETDGPATAIIVGVRFRTAGKIYYFAPGDLPVKRGCHVIVETARGIEYGFVVSNPMEIDRKKFKAPLKQILRIATEADDAKEKENREKEREAYRVCLGKIRRHNLDMKLIDAEYTFDNNKILFYFTADGRVDFRDLVKDLAGIFRTRIELRQIGVRDETKILGGYGICGRPLCCHTYLSDFIPVSIKMAKEQNLSLNPTKISGVCGRLMCCLKNEEDTYEELNRRLPKVGDEVRGSDGLEGEVESVNVLRQRVRILVEIEDEKELHEYGADEITVLRRRRRGAARPKLHRNEAAVVHSSQPAARDTEKESGKGAAQGGSREGRGRRRGGEKPAPRDGQKNQAKDAQERSVNANAAARNASGKEGAQPAAGAPEEKREKQEGRRFSRRRRGDRSRTQNAGKNAGKNVSQGGGQGGNDRKQE